jgi:signal transduction histidine kinase
MSPRLTLLHKVLILVAIPLMFELLFICQLAVGLQEAEAESAKQQWVYDVVSTTNTLSVSLFALLRTVSSPWGLNRAPKHVQYEQYRKLVDASLGRLDELSHSHVTFEREMAPMSAIISKVLGFLDAVEAKAERGQSVSMSELVPLITIAPILESRSQSFTSFAMRMREEVENRRQTHSRKLRNWLIAGVSFNISLALGLTVIFNRSASRRLKLVLENSRRLAAGQALLPVTEGGDEIAHVDQTFHAMALALETARAKERARTEEIMHIVQNMPVGLVMTDASGKVRHCNNTLAQTLALDQSELVDSEMTSHVAIDGAVSIEFADLLKIGPMTEIDLITNSGFRVPCHCSASALLQSQNHDTRYLLAFLDETQKRQFEKARQAFLSMVTNELRRPLYQMQKFFAGLQDDPNGDMNDQTLEHAKLGFGSVSRMLRMVNDLLDFESAGDKALVLTRRNVDINELIQKSIAETTELARAQRIGLVHEGDPATVFVDADRFVQVLINLISNAIKFSPPDSDVRIIVNRQPDGATEICVSDKGRGIPTDQQQLIFEKFRQVSVDDSRRAKGVGLGLPICKAMVERHGGSIRVQSADGAGSSFYILLPPRPEPNATTLELDAFESDSDVQVQELRS